MSVAKVTYNSSIPIVHVQPKDKVKIDDLNEWSQQQVHHVVDYSTRKRKMEQRMTLARAKGWCTSAITSRYMLLYMYVTSRNSTLYRMAP